MKTFIVDTGKKKYKVKANNAEHAVKLIKKINDEASQLQTVNALIEDEKAAVEAYNVALENLKGKIPDESYAAIEAIRDDENRHIENLQAVVNGTVTEKNLEDSMMNDNDDIGLSLERSLKRLDWNYTVGKIYDYIRTHAVYGVPNTPDAINRVKEVLSKHGATKFKVVKNDYGFAIVSFKAKDSINGTVTEKNLEDSMKDASYIVQVGSQFIRKSTAQYWYTDRDNATRFSRKEAETFVAEYEPSGKIIKDAKISYEDAQESIKDASLSVYHYKSPISSRQSIQIQKDGREIYTFMTAAEAIAFANKILSIAAKLPK